MDNILYTLLFFQTLEDALLDVYRKIASLSPKLLVNELWLYICIVENVEKVSVL